MTKNEHLSKPSYNRHCKGVREIMTDHTAFNPCSPLPPWISSKVLYHCWAIWHEWSTRFDWPSHYFSLPYIFVLWLAPGTDTLTPDPTRERTSDVDHGEVKSFKGEKCEGQIIWSPAPESSTGSATDNRFWGPEFKVRFPVWCVIISPILLHY